MNVGHSIPFFLFFAILTAVSSYRVVLIQTSGSRSTVLICGELSAPWPPQNPVAAQLFQPLVHSAAHKRQIHPAGLVVPAGSGLDSRKGHPEWRHLKMQQEVSQVLFQVAWRHHTERKAFRRTLGALAGFAHQPCLSPLVKTESKPHYGNSVFRFCTDS